MKLTKLVGCEKELVLICFDIRMETINEETIRYKLDV